MFAFRPSAPVGWASCQPCLALFTWLHGLTLSRRLGLSTGPHPVVNIPNIIQLPGILCVYTRVCECTTCIYGDRAKPHHRAAHLVWTAPSWRTSGSAHSFVPCSCPPAETHSILLILTRAEIIKRLTTSGISSKCLFTLE